MSSNFIALVLLAVSPLVHAKEVTPFGQNSPFIKAPIFVKMESVFTVKEEEVVTGIPFETQYQENPEEEYGQEKTLQEGQPGVLRQIFKVTFWRDEEIDRDLVSQREDPPTPEIISLGTKIVWRDLPTPEDGVLQYWYKISAVATAYSPFCIGCLGRTAMGTIAGRGSCAVDPAVVKLGTKIYVSGYGICTAEDTGGTIKGNRVDVCFASNEEAVRWGRREVEIYLLTR